MILRDIIQDHAFNRRLIVLSVPITVQSLMLALVAAGDAVMLGRVSQNAMAAVSLATQIQFVQNMILFAIVAGIGVMGAQYWGKGDREVLGRIFGISIRMSVGVCIVFFLGCRWFPEKLMLLFAHDGELIRTGAEYLEIAAWSYLLTGFSQCYLGIMKISEHVTCSAVISSAAVVLNIILNAVFIFGLCGCPAMGVRGAALATVAARGIELVWCILVSRKPDFIRLHFRNIITFDRQLSADFLHYMLPILGAYLLWGTGFTAYTAIMGHLGPDAAAANSIAAVVRDLLCCLCNGFAGAAGIMIGNELGAGNLERGRVCGDRIAVISVFLGLTCTVVVLASIPAVTSFMKLTPQAETYMRGMFMILSVYMIGRCICTMIINGIFSAGGDTLFDVYSLIVCMWGIALPCAFLSAFYWQLPVLAAYGCTCLDEVGKVPWVICHHRQYKWVRNITR
ncbi:MAG: MATE family efflux transporter [Lentisphaerae bacterium]|nr:MATE family efflux transporter [Lentisphaerota bacterium]